MGIYHALQGEGGLTKLGTGTLTLGAAMGYQGMTVVAEGNLHLGTAGSVAGGITVMEGAILTGAGSIGGSTLITGTHRVGSSPGLQTFADLTYDTGAVIEWELFSHADSVDNPGLRGQPTGWDGINVTGTLLFSGDTQLAIALGGSVDLLDGYWQSNRSWLVFDVGPGGSLAGFGDHLSLATTNPAGFSLRQNGTDVWLDYNASSYAVPEPGTALVFLLGAVGLGLQRRRGC